MSYLLHHREREGGKLSESPDSPRNQPKAAAQGPGPWFEPPRPVPFPGPALPPEPEELLQVAGLEEGGDLGFAGPRVEGVRAGLANIAARQTRMIWFRASIADWLATGGPGGSPIAYSIAPVQGRMSLVLEQPMPLPSGWNTSGAGAQVSPFFTENSKMQCPSWDLTAGPPGPRCLGTCPSSVPAWLMEPEGARKSVPILAAPGGGSVQEVNIHQTVCALCYASGTGFAYGHTQLRELVLFWWAQDCMAQDPERFVSTMVEAIQMEAARMAPDRFGIKPFRVHSSGDFFDVRYLRAWGAVADRLYLAAPQVVLWAPTRAWASADHQGRPVFPFDEVLGENHARAKALRRAPNFVVRCSAYHVDQVAPGALIKGGALGCATIWDHHNLGMAPALELTTAPNRREVHLRNRQDPALAPFRRPDGSDARYHFECPAYARVGNQDLAKSCAVAPGPDGQPGCRVCWGMGLERGRALELAVNFPLH